MGDYSHTLFIYFNFGVLFLFVLPQIPDLFMFLGRKAFGRFIVGRPPLSYSGLSGGHLYLLLEVASAASAATFSLFFIFKFFSCN